MEKLTDLYLQVLLHMEIKHQSIGKAEDYDMPIEMFNMIIEQMIKADYIEKMKDDSYERHTDGDIAAETRYRISRAGRSLMQEAHKKKK